MFCTNCGKEINENARFCAHCGFELAVGKQAETVAFDERKDENPKKITLVTGLLLGLLGIKLIAMLFMTFYDPINVIDLIIIVVIIFGILFKSKWGSLLAMGYSALVIFVNLSEPVPTSVLGHEIYESAGYFAGGIIMGFLIFILAWKEYNTLKNSRIVKEGS